MRRVLGALVWAGALAVVAGFFLPWALIDVREAGVVRQLRQAAPIGGTIEGVGRDLGRIAVRVRRGAETVTGELPSLEEIPRQVSGVQIPRLANDERAQLAVALVELLTDTRQHLGMKSFLVYLLPGLAIGCAILLALFGRRPAVALGVSLLCALIAGAGFWKLLTADTEALFIAITIGPGLWLSLWAYAALAVLALLHPVLGRLRV